MNAYELMEMLDKLPEKFKSMQLYNFWDSAPINAVSLYNFSNEGMRLQLTSNGPASVDEMLAKLEKGLQDHLRMNDELRNAERDRLLRREYHDDFSPDFLDSYAFKSTVCSLNGIDYRGCDERMPPIKRGELKKSVEEAIEIFRDKRAPRVKKTNDYRMLHFADSPSAKVLGKTTISHFEAEYDEAANIVRFKVTERWVPSVDSVNGHNTYRIEETYHWTVSL